MDARSRAFVVHLTPHRIRIKIPGREGQDAYFAALHRMLEQRPDIISVRVNALVASIVIHCGDGFEITSVRNCLTEIELVLPDGLRTNPPARQIASDRRGGGCSQSTSFNHSISLVSLVVKLTIAIATKRLLEAVIRELIVEAVARALLSRLYRRRAPRSGAPRVLLAAAAG